MARSSPKQCSTQPAWGTANAARKQRKRHAGGTDGAAVVPTNTELRGTPENILVLGKAPLTSDTTIVR